MRSSTIASIAMVPSFLLTMLPMMAVPAFPLAAGLAIAIPIGNLLVNDELMIVLYLRRARAALHQAVLLLSIFFTVIYAGLVLWWAPQSHLHGKQLLFSFASTQFAQLEPGIFHAPFPGLTLYFKQKSIDTVTGNVAYSPIFLAYFKDNEHYLFTARSGVVRNGTIYLVDGNIYSIGKQQSHTALFEETAIDIKHFFEGDTKRKQSYHLKFMTLGQLCDYKDTTGVAMAEVHKRVAQILWQFLFPFFALLGVMVFGRRKSNLLTSLLFVGGLYVLSYASIAAGQNFGSQLLVMSAFLYLCPLAIFGVMLNYYRLRL